MYISIKKDAMMSHLAIVREIAERDNMKKTYSPLSKHSANGRSPSRSFSIIIPCIASLELKRHLSRRLGWSGVCPKGDFSSWEGV